jgi:hypothetical protein
MKSQYIKSIAFIFGIILSQTIFAASESATVKWTGLLNEKREYHYYSPDQSHNLEFISNSDNQSFDIVESEDLVNYHTQKDKILEVEIEGQITPRFLFWGGNLKVTSFKILKELEAIPRREPSKQFNTAREFRFRGSNF